MKQIPFATDYYMDPDNAVIYSEKSDKFLKIQKNNCGYETLCLIHNDGTKKTHSIHTLLGKTFIPNPDPAIYDEIDHINRNKLDNRLCNLKWSNRELQQQNIIKPNGKSGIKHIKYRETLDRYCYTRKIDGELYYKSHKKLVDTLFEQYIHRVLLTRDNKIHRPSFRTQ